MPTADNLNDMSWSERRRLEQQHFNALREASQARINAERAASSCDNVPELARATFAVPAPTTNAETGSLFEPSHWSAP